MIRLVFLELAIIYLEPFDVLRVEEEEEVVVEEYSFYLKSVVIRKMHSKLFDHQPLKEVVVVVEVEYSF